MLRGDRRLLALAIVSAAVSGVSWGSWIVSGSNAALGLTLALHVVCAGLTATQVTRRRRSLALALGLVIPVVGPLAAVLATQIAGRGGAELLHDPHAVTRRIDGTAVAHLLTNTLPVCTALVSADVLARRQALAKLTTRAAPEDIATLRWARALRKGDATVEVALALEEIGARFEQRAGLARAAATTAPTYASLSTAFLILTAGITSGVVDPPLVSRLAAEGCRHHDAAISLEPARARELLAGRVRLALAVGRPVEALELLTRPDVDLAADAELADLYREAAYAARRFDLVPDATRASA